MQTEDKTPSAANGHVCSTDLLGQFLDAAKRDGVTRLIPTHPDDIRAALDAKDAEIDRLRVRLDKALFVLVMVDKNNRIAAGEKVGKAWNGRFVVAEVRRVLDEAARAAGPNVELKGRHDQA